MLITGMKDTRCRQKITDALEAVAGVLDVNVNLFRANATVCHAQTCSPDRLIAAVARVGYEATRDDDRHIDEPRRRS
ncbi:MAG: cation transporter [Phycisphaerales bacterium]|nr:cation transporter [Phycisphaerales bacterium]